MICDPSHICGNRALLKEVAQKSMDLDFDGLMLEAHPNPDVAKCDGPCALRLSQLEPFLAQLKQLDTLVKGFEVLDTH